MIKVLPALAAHIISSGSGTLTPKTTPNHFSPRQPLEIAKGVKPTNSVPTDEPKQGCTINASLYGSTKEELKEELSKFALFLIRPSNNETLTSSANGKVNPKTGSVDLKLTYTNDNPQLIAKIYSLYPSNKQISYSRPVDCTSGKKVDLDFARTDYNF
jgi:ABC-type glycerol-3-phosphate transport system substrate-binding protein